MDTATPAAPPADETTAPSETASGAGNPSQASGDELPVVDWTADLPAARSLYCHAMSAFLSGFEPQPTDAP